ncbi:MAG: IS1096 element passenger TnpR family protein [Bacteroidota bacterium]
MIYKFRIILDSLDDVFRDIEVKEDCNLEDFHNVITQSFGFDGSEMASFYLSDDDWSQGEEIVLFDMSEGSRKVKTMRETQLNSVVSKENTKLIYVYDFFSMWTFYVELADIAESESDKDYPNLMFSQGQLPDSPPEKKFEAEELDDFKDDFGSEFDEDNIDFENLDDIDFDQNWN